jgi:hypothetical protein
MIPILVGLVLTAVLVTVFRRHAGLNAADMGSMSTNWVAAHRAVERNSSI